MRYGVTLSYDESPAEVVELALEAEHAGWDGVFIWDGITGLDVWVMLAAIAARTERVRLGPMLTPVSRRRPWKLAQECATLDRLSRGRALLPVGLGAPETGFAKFGEATDRKQRAERLDEGLAVVDGLWRGKRFSYSGQHYRIDKATFSPTPLQQPRVPIWVVAAWPRMRSMRRAVAWDGVLPVFMDEGGTMRSMPPDELRAMLAWLGERRGSGAALDVVMEGETPGADPAAAARQLEPLAEAGLTWWLENVWAAPREKGGVGGMRQRIRQGPPRL